MELVKLYAQQDWWSWDNYAITKIVKGSNDTFYWIIQSEYYTLSLTLSRQKVHISQYEIVYYTHSYNDIIL